MKEFWQQELITIGKFTLTPAKILLLFLILIATAVVLFVIKKILLSKKGISSNEIGRRNSVFQLIKYFVWVLALCFCINSLGFDLTLLIAGSAALLVGLGFGLQNIFSDLVSGLFMLFEQKVKVGDIMEVDDIVGKVQDINLRTSTLFTREGYSIIIPNHKFISDNIVNWSHQSSNRRFDIEVGVSYDSDVKLVSDVLLQCGLDHPELIKEGAQKPFIRFKDFGDSALLFQMMFWTNDNFGVENIKSDIRYRIMEAFRKNKITIPFPQRDLHFVSNQANLKL